MCLLVFAWRQCSQFPLIFAGNRDELHRRPAVPATFWAEAPRVIGGRDLDAGGSWLGVSLDGRFAVVTNYRERAAKPSGTASRGSLVMRFLRGTSEPLDFADGLGDTRREYAGFNLLCGNHTRLCYVSNRSAQARPLAPGVYGLSNELLDTPWPKVVKARTRLARLLARGPPDPEALLDLLSDRTYAAGMKPSNGNPEQSLERQLSAIFVAHPGYGTRCSTIVLIRADGLIRFVERSYMADAKPAGTRAFTVGAGA